MDSNMSWPWSHLPNAGHIDRILADNKRNFNHWAKAWYSSASWNSAWGEAWCLAQETAWAAAQEAAKEASGDTARGAIYTLIAWDHAGSYMSLPTDKIEVLAALGDKIAILMLPAMIALNKSIVKQKND